MAEMKLDGSRLESFDPSAFAAYQALAAETSQYELRGGPQGAIAPMLALAGETGAILDAHKRLLRDTITFKVNRDLLRDELGDLLWYIAAVATAANLDLGEIAKANLERTRDLYPTRPIGDCELRQFDADYPIHERFPRRLTILFDGRNSSGRDIATQKIIAAEPFAFRDGPMRNVDGEPLGFVLGGPLGNLLTDNTSHADGYRFHDAIHLAFAAVLGWSPTLRRMLNLRRRSDADTNEKEDGARAVFAEEGLSAMLSRMAPKRRSFHTEDSVDGTTLDLAKEVTEDLEVNAVPGWLWRRAISRGFCAMHRLAENGGGYLIADLDKRDLTHTIVLP